MKVPAPQKYYNMVYGTAVCILRLLLHSVGCSTVRNWSVIGWLLGYILPIAFSASLGVFSPVGWPPDVGLLQWWLAELSFHSFQVRIQTFHDNRRNRIHEIIRFAAGISLRSCPVSFLKSPSWAVSYANANYYRLISSPFHYIHSCHPYMKNGTIFVATMRT